MDIFKHYVKESIKNPVGFSTGITTLDYAIGKIQPRTYYGLASAPKVGKSALTLTHFILEPWLDAIKQKKKIKILYFSYEMDLLKNMARITTSLYAKHTGNYDISYNYFFGKLVDKVTGNYIKPSDKDVKLFLELYDEYTVKLFGKRDRYGRLKEPGVIEFYGEADNPTGYFKEVLAFAERRGELIREEMDIGGRLRKRLIGYKPNDENEFVIVILDNLRKLIPEKGKTLKQTADVAISYTATLRNILGWSFLHIIHLNRSLSNVDRLRYMGENIYPDNEDIKETGNLSEEVDVMMTLFNPNDTKYNLKRHMGVDLSKHKNYRSLHIIEARDIPSPTHIRLSFYSGCGVFKKLETEQKNNLFNGK